MPTCSTPLSFFLFVKPHRAQSFSRIGSKLPPIPRLQDVRICDVKKKAGKCRICTVQMPCLHSVNAVFTQRKCRIYTARMSLCLALFCIGRFPMKINFLITKSISQTYSTQSADIRKAVYRCIMRFTCAGSRWMTQQSAGRSSMAMAFISSTLSTKSKTSKFSLMRSICVLLGMATIPRCMR